MSNEIPVWTKFTGNCQSCNRDFHVSQQAIDDHRKIYPAASEFEAANCFEVCLSCVLGRDIAGEHDFNPRVLTEAHLRAIEMCLDVADPCDDIAAEAIDGGPAAIHAKAKEALEILRSGHFGAKPGTIVLTVEGGLVSDCYADMEDPPHVYVVDFDTVRTDEDSDYAIKLEIPLTSLEGGPSKMENALCYEWTPQQVDFAAIKRLETALAATHETEPEGKVFYPGDEKELNEAIDAHVTRTPEGWDSIDTLTEHHTNVAQEEPVENWRLPPNHRLDAHRAAHAEPGTATRLENDGTLSL